MGLNAFYNTKLKQFVPDAASQFDSGYVLRSSVSRMVFFFFLYRDFSFKGVWKFAFIP